MKAKRYRLLYLPKAELPRNFAETSEMESKLPKPMSPNLQALNLLLVKGKAKTPEQAARMVVRHNQRKAQLARSAKAPTPPCDDWSNAT